MKIKYTKKEYRLANSKDGLKCECYHCGKNYLLEKSSIDYELKNENGRNKYCSNKCKHKSRNKKEKVSCATCGDKFIKELKEIKKSKSGNHFCTRSCSAIYNNKNKKYGISRSKLEVWMEDQLTTLMPDEEIHFNKKDTIDSELDIYFPDKNIAIEINGPHHYKAMYGIKKFVQTQRNDIKKKKECGKLGIKLHHINTTTQKNFKISTSQIFLDKIIELVS